MNKVLLLVMSARSPANIVRAASLGADLSPHPSARQRLAGSTGAQIERPEYYCNRLGKAKIISSRAGS